MGISLVEMLSWCCQQIVPPLVTTEDDADPSSDLGFIKTGTTWINPNAGQFYPHPHPRSLHHTTAATFVSTHLKTASFSLMRVRSERSSWVWPGTCYSGRAGAARATPTPVKAETTTFSYLFTHHYHVKFCTHCTGNEIISMYLPQFISTCSSWSS